MLIFSDKFQMEANLSKKLFVDEIGKKEFTTTVSEWFEGKAGLKVSTHYQRKESIVFWWSIIVYCANKKCKREYKLKGNVKELRKGKSTDITIYCKFEDYCSCSK